MSVFYTGEARTGVGGGLRAVLDGREVSLSPRVSANTSARSGLMAP